MEYEAPQVIDIDHLDVVLSALFPDAADPRQKPTTLDNRSINVYGSSSKSSGYIRGVRINLFAGVDLRNDEETS
jgi:hypothetical protein